MKNARHISNTATARRQSGAVTPLQRQADEGELALAQQRFESAQVLDVGDAEVETRLVNEQVYDREGKTCQCAACGGTVRLYAEPPK